MNPYFNPDRDPWEELVSSTKRWMRKGGYSCKNCGCKVSWLASMDWRVTKGLARFGACDDCGTLLVEYEKTRDLTHEPTQWFDLNTWWGRFTFHCWKKLNRGYYADAYSRLNKKKRKQLKLP